MTMGVASIHLQVAGATFQPTEPQIGSNATKVCLKELQLRH